MHSRELRVSPTLFGEIPIDHITLEIPLDHGDVAIGYAIRGTSIDGSVVFSTALSKGAFDSVSQMLGLIVGDLEEALRLASKGV